MSYSVKEVYYTLQGEGSHSGRPAVFVRFSGCNLWSGQEKDRSGAVCQFCDTDFVGIDGPGGGKFRNPTALASHILTFWPRNTSVLPYVVFTGGEPMLQLDQPLIDALHECGVYIAIETNGTLPVPESVDWICVSPKANAPWIQRTGNELKLVYPQPTLLPETLGEMSFNSYYLQPMDGPDLDKNTQQAIDYCKQNPEWHLSIQSHKVLQIP
jgi:7-carboxy-7-deazaguanine synthase (Cx14CxxC type)